MKKLITLLKQLLQRQHQPLYYKDNTNKDVEYIYKKENNLFQLIAWKYKENPYFSTLEDCQSFPLEIRQYYRPEKLVTHKPGLELLPRIKEMKPLETTELQIILYSSQQTSYPVPPRSKWYRD